VNKRKKEMLFAQSAVTPVASAHAVYAENISASITPDSSTLRMYVYLTNPLEMTVGDNVTWINGEDTAPHTYTVTSGTGVGDSNSGQVSI
jgi:plastocyanin